MPLRLQHRALHCTFRDLTKRAQTPRRVCQQRQTWLYVWLPTPPNLRGVQPFLIRIHHVNFFLNAQKRQVRWLIFRNRSFSFLEHFYRSHVLVFFFVAQIAQTKPVCPFHVSQRNLQIYEMMRVWYWFDCFLDRWCHAMDPNGKVCADSL